MSDLGEDDLKGFLVEIKATIGAVFQEDSTDEERRKCIEKQLQATGFCGIEVLSVTPIPEHFN